jgi:hypothetical protein
MRLTVDFDDGPAESLEKRETDMAGSNLDGGHLFARAHNSFDGTNMADHPLVRPPGKFYCCLLRRKDEREINLAWLCQGVALGPEVPQAIAIIIVREFLIVSFHGGEVVGLTLRILSDRATTTRFEFERQEGNR